MQKLNIKENLKKMLSFGGVTLWGAVLFAFLVIFDLATKVLAEKFLSNKSVRLIGDFVVLQLKYNRGISFGMFSEGSIAVKVAIVVVTAVLMIALSVFYMLVDRRRRLLRISLIFIVAGGIGNLVDRLIYRVWQPGGAKGVRDMVDVSGIQFGSFNFGICNFADFFITAGAIMLVLSFLFFDVEALFPTKKSKALSETLAIERGEENNVQEGEQIAKSTEEKNSEGEK